MVNWTLGNKLQWNFNRNSYNFIEENAYENVVCETVAILSRTQYVKQKYRKISFIHNSYRKISNISLTLVGNKTVDPADVVGVHLHSRFNTWIEWIGQRQLQDEISNIYVLEFGAIYIRGLMVFICQIFV